MTYALKVLATIVLVAMCLSAILTFLARVPSMVVIGVGAVFFTYAIYPIVRWLNARIPLLWAIVIVYAFIVAILAILGLTIVPALASDVQSLVASAPHFVRVAQDFVDDPKNPIVTHLPVPVRTYLATLPIQADALARRYAGQAASGAFAVVLSLVSLVATVVVIPVMSIYLMIETPGLLRSFTLRLPPRFQAKAGVVLRDIDTALGGFIRGQLLVGAVIGFCIIAALLILHVRYAVLIGVVAGLFDVIPFVGAFVGFVPAVLLALVDDGWQHALIVAVVFVALFQAEGHFIAPKIVSDSVGLSPLMVIVAILIGGELLGIAGMFLAVPLAAIVRVIVLNAFPERPPAIVASSVFAGETAVAMPPREISSSDRAEVR